ncbi:MAG: hypothetical protein NTX59_12855 [Elusimicrobia bacterium]|nr:hypothetical protein [Elusimicrobiota bacterium]
MNENIKVITLDFVNAFLLKAENGYVLIDTGLPGHGKPFLMTDYLNKPAK